MARQLSLPESTVRRRIDRLLAGVVIKIVAAANSEKLGLTVHVVMGLSVDIARGREVIQAIARLDETRWVAATTGPYDIMLEAYFRTMRHLHAFITVELAAIPGVERVESAIVLDLAKHAYDWRQLMAAADRNGREDRDSDAAPLVGADAGSRDGAMGRRDRSRSPAMGQGGAGP